MLKEFIKFADEILESNARTHKIKVLEKYKDNEDIKYLLNFIYNPFIITGISRKKYSKNVLILEHSTQSYTTLKELLEYLQINNTGTDENISIVHNSVESILIEEGLAYDLKAEETIARIIIKDLPLGIDVSTINKVMPHLIDDFKVQLANKYFDKPQVVEGKEFSITTKIDGGRIIALKENGVVNFYTRQGQKYEGLVDLENEMLSMPWDNICFDGELTVLDKGKMTSKDQYKQTMKISRADGIKSGLKMLVFDFMPASSFKQRKYTASYKERRVQLDEIFNNYESKYFELLPILYSGTDTNEITKWLNYNVAHGEEGVMININNAPYEWKRTNNLLKCKLFNDLDLPIVGFEEGTNKYLGMLGALLVSYKGNIVKVGSGFTDELRKEIWANKDEWLGLTAVVQYFEETQNADNSYSLRFPVFLDVRQDK